MVVYGAQRRPRALLENLPDDLADQITPLFGSTRRVTPGEQVDESEYDVLVTLGDVTRSSRLHTLALGCRRAHEVSSYPWPHAVADLATLATQLDVPPAVSGMLRDLVVRTLVPVVAQLESRFVWRATAWHPTAGRRDTSWPPESAILTTHTPSDVLAFDFHRTSVGGGLLVALPVVPDELPAWVAWFLGRVRGVDPGAFPPSGAWREDAQWADPALAVAAEQLAGIDAERRSVLVELEAREQAARLSAAAAQAATEAGPWRLLTEQGETLVEAVVVALESFGFKVEDRDAGLAPGAPKMEACGSPTRRDPTGWRWSR